ncbi:MAG: hypothetical protein GC201_10365 [Alphaproteobacteria bacterium]|nr:hypothetical protein [Alphaproteobacteria bacterium]
MADIAIFSSQNNSPNAPPAIYLTNSGNINGDIVLHDQGDIVRNLMGGEVVGRIDLGDGSDRVINLGTVIGAVDLGAGDDFYLVGAGTGSQSGGAVTGGSGFDSAGFYSNTTETQTLTLVDGFEGTAVYADENSVFTIGADSGGQADLNVSLLGSGIVINEAHLVATGGIPAIKIVDAGLEFRNENLIEAGANGVVAGDGDIIVNGTSGGAGGTISSTNFAIVAGNGNDIVNFGALSSDTGGILVAEDNKDDLNGDGFAGVTNAGIIYATTGVDIRGSSIGGVGNNQVANQGTIDAQVGILATSSGNRIENSGTIVSDYYGVRVAGASDNAITNTATGTISSWNDAINVYGDHSSIVNSGLVVAGDQGLDEGGQPDPTGAHGIELQGSDSSITNQLGTIRSGTGHAVLVQGDANVITDNGTPGVGDGIIDSTGGQTGIVGLDAIHVEGAQNNVIINEGGQVLAHRYGVDLSGTFNSLANSGLIDGDTGVHLEGGGNSLVNNGTIQGKTAAIDNLSGSATIENSGVINGDILLGPSADTIALAAGSVVSGTVAGGGGFDTITSTGDGSFEGTMSDVEKLDVQSGMLRATFTSPSAVTTTTVEGALELNGTLSTNASISTNGVLSGTGTIGGSLLNQGRVAPGNSIGTFGIDGDYTQASTGRLSVELGEGAGDLLAVTGTAALDGTLTTALQADDLSSLAGNSYTVLTAGGGISGSLATTGSVQQGFWTLDVAQGANDVTVTVTSVDVPLGATPTARSVLGGALTAASGGSGQGGSGIVVTGDTNTTPVVDQSSESQISQQLASLDYASMGGWESDAAGYVGGLDALGPGTPATSMPKTGTAEFAGTTRGDLTEQHAGGPEAFVVEGNVLMRADFARGLVNADFTGMEKIDAQGVASAWVDFRARMRIADGSSQFAGAAQSDDGTWHGDAQGGFFGDDNGVPGHAAGLWHLSSPLGHALGGFTAKRQ